jgi:hypothetical protein
MKMVIWISILFCLFHTVLERIHATKVVIDQGFGGATKATAVVI